MTSKIGNLHNEVVAFVAAGAKLPTDTWPKELFQTRKSAKFTIELTDGKEYTLEGDIQQAMETGYKKMLDVLCIVSSDEKVAAQTENGRRIMFGFLLAILASELKKRTLYTIALLQASGLDVKAFIEETKIVAEYGPVNARVYELLAELAEEVVKHEGYKSVADIFKHADGAMPDAGDVFKF